MHLEMKHLMGTYIKYVMMNHINIYLEHPGTCFLFALGQQKTKPPKGGSNSNQNTEHLGSRYTYINQVRVHFVDTPAKSVWGSPI